MFASWSWAYFCCLTVGVQGTSGRFGVSTPFPLCINCLVASCRMGLGSWSLHAGAAEPRIASSPSRTSGASMLYDPFVSYHSGNMAGMRAVLDACETRAARPMGAFHEARVDLEPCPATHGRESRVLEWHPVMPKDVAGVTRGRCAEATSRVFRRACFWVYEWKGGEQEAGVVGC